MASCFPSTFAKALMECNVYLLLCAAKCRRQRLLRFPKCLRYSLQVSPVKLLQIKWRND
jgi:hypothetical protein